MATPTSAKFENRNKTSDSRFAISNQSVERNREASPTKQAPQLEQVRDLSPLGIESFTPNNDLILKL